MHPTTVRIDVSTASSHFVTNVDVSMTGKRPYQLGGLRKGFGVVLIVSDTVVDAVSVKIMQRHEQTTATSKPIIVVRSIEHDSREWRARINWQHLELFSLLYF